MDPEIDLVPAIAVIEPDELAYAHYQGHEGVRRWFADIAELGDYRVEFDHFHRAGDDDVLVTSRVYFLQEGGDHGGRVYDIYYLFRFRDGKVLSLQTYRDEDEARQAAGLTD